jgi:hypothetical protein
MFHDDCGCAGRWRTVYTYSLCPRKSVVLGFSDIVAGPGSRSCCLQCEGPAEGRREEKKASNDVVVAGPGSSASGSVECDPAKGTASNLLPVAKKKYDVGSSFDSGK